VFDAAPAMKKVRDLFRRVAIVETTVSQRGMSHHYQRQNSPYAKKTQAPAKPKFFSSVRRYAPLGRIPAWSTHSSIHADRKQAPSSSLLARAAPPRCIPLRTFVPESRQRRMRPILFFPCGGFSSDIVLAPLSALLSIGMPGRKSTRRGTQKGVQGRFVRVDGRMWALRGR